MSPFDYLRRAIVLEGSGEYQQAREQLDLGIELAAKEGDVAKMSVISGSASIICLHHGDTEAAITLLTNVLALKHNDARTLYSLGSIYWDLGRVEEARECWGRCRAATEDPDLLELLASREKR